MELRHLRYFIACRGRQPVDRRPAAAEHLAAVVEPADSRSRIRSRREAAGAAGARRCRSPLPAAYFSITHGWRCLQVEAAIDGARASGTAGKAYVRHGVSGWAGGRVAAPRVAHNPRGSAGGRNHAQSQSSPELALALMRGKLDVAFLRPETRALGLSFRFLAKEPLIAVLPADHRLTSRKKIRPQDLAG